MRKPPVLFTSLVALILLAGVPLPTAAQVNWRTWQEVDELCRQQPRKIFVDVYTKWCKWCEKMDALTFQDPHITNYLNTHYYCIRFNAEQAESIEFGGQTWHFLNKKGYHELAAAILNDRMSYPSIVFLDENKNLIQSIPGFKSPQDFEVIISYFATGQYMRTPWGVYKEQYFSSKPD